MAGGPYGKNNEVKYLTWSDKSLHPEKPKIKESLRTRKMDEAYRRKIRLEELRDKGKHDPWHQKWFENPTIKPFVSGSLLSGNPMDIHHSPKITLFDASEEYIKYQINRPRGWQSPRTQELYPATIRYFVKNIGPRKFVDSVTEEDIYPALFRKTESGKVVSDETARSDRSKLIAFFNWCKKKGWLQVIPEIETPEPQSKVPKFLTEQQFLTICLYKVLETETMIKEGKLGEYGQHGLRYVLAWMVLAGTGVRPIEACSIRLQDIYGDQILIGAHTRTKTNAQRMVRILYEAERAVSVLSNPKYRKLDPALNKTDLLLGIGSNMTKRRIAKDITRCWTECYPKLGKRTAYNLRDFFAVRFLSDNSHGNKDFRLLQLRNQLGHSTIKTTEKYLKAIPGKLNLSLPKDINLAEIYWGLQQKLHSKFQNSSIE